MVTHAGISAIIGRQRETRTLSFCRVRRTQKEEAVRKPKRWFSRNQTFWPILVHIRKCDRCGVLCTGNWGVEKRRKGILLLEFFTLILFHRIRIFFNLFTLLQMFSIFHPFAYLYPTPSLPSWASQFSKQTREHTLIKFSKTYKHLGSNFE